MINSIGLFFKHSPEGMGPEPLGGETFNTHPFNTHPFDTHHLKTQSLTSQAPKSQYLNIDNLIPHPFGRDKLTSEGLICEGLICEGLTSEGVRNFPGIKKALLLKRAFFTFIDKISYSSSHSFA